LFIKKLNNLTKKEILLYYFCAKNRTFTFSMQTADLIFVSTSGLMFDVYNILWLIVITYL